MNRYTPVNGSVDMEKWRSGSYILYEDAVAALADALGWPNNPSCAPWNWEILIRIVEANRVKLNKVKQFIEENFE